MRAIVLGCVSLLAASAAQADVGIGASIRSDDAAVYVPVMAEKLMVEPYVSYSREKDDIGPDSETTTIGVGVFGVAAPADNFSIYFGGRLARLNDEVVTPLTDFITGVSVGVTRSETEGYAIAPTLGFQYHVIERFTVGAEVGVEYSDVDLERVVEPLGQPSLPSLTLNRKSTETKARVILRFFF